MACTQNLSITFRPELFCGVGRRGTAAPTERDQALAPDLLSQEKEEPSLEDVIKINKLSSFSSEKLYWLPPIQLGFTLWASPLSSGPGFNDLHLISHRLLTSVFIKLFSFPDLGTCQSSNPSAL